MSTRVPAEVFPPGEFLRDEIEARGWTQTDLAEILGRPFRLVNEILQGKRAITPETAQGLGAAFGTGAQFWMNLESTYRLSLSDADEAGVARRARLYAKAPIKDMVRRGWLSGSEDIDDIEGQVLRFFELASIDDVPRLVAAARKSTGYLATSASQLAWIYRAKHLASALDVSPFDHLAFTQALPGIKRLLGTRNGEAKVAKTLADLGIRFVVVEHLPRTKIDGAAFWIDASPVIALSLRHDRIDGFWFTLAHELGHIYYQDGLSVDDDLVGEAGSGGQMEVTDAERLANAFASNLIVDPAKLDAFIRATRPYYSKLKIHQFAQEMEVYPGIILGQLQRRGEISYASNREMLLKIRESVTKNSPTDGWDKVAFVS